MYKVSLLVLIIIALLTVIFIAGYDLEDCFEYISDFFRTDGRRMLLGVWFTIFNVVREMIYLADI